MGINGLLAVEAIDTQERTEHEATGVSSIAFFGVGLSVI